MGEVDLQVGEAREAELMETDIFFKPALKKGAQMARHANTVPSAQDIVRLILNSDPLPLQIQRELVVQRKDITQTRAGQELNRELSAKVREHMEEIRVLKEEMQEAINDRDEETRREREIETKKMQDEMERIENDARRFASDYQREKEELEARLEEVKKTAKREADRIAAMCQARIDELNASTQANTAAAEAEKAQMREQIEELAAQKKKIDINPYLLALAVSAVVVGPAIGAVAIIPELGAAALPLVEAATAALVGVAIPALGRACLLLIP